MPSPLDLMFYDPFLGVTLVWTAGPMIGVTLTLIGSLFGPEPVVGQPAPNATAEGAVEAALRQEVQLWRLWLTDDARQARTVVCLAVDPSLREDLSDSSLRRLGDPAIRGAADCEARPEGSVERVTGNPAVLVTAVGIEWIANDEAWVSIRHFRSRQSNASRQYRVVREREGWTCLGPILRGIPLE